VPADNRIGRNAFWSFYNGTGDCSGERVVNMRRLALVCCAFLAACAPAPTASPTPPGSTPQAILASTPSQTSPTLTSTAITPADTAAPDPTGTPPPEPAASFNVCSPLEDLAIPDLYELVKNPFVAPRPGQDNGHHGADFAYYSLKDHPQMQGTRVFAVLGGLVAAVLPDQRPYGYAVIVETPVGQLAPGFLENLDLTLQPTPQPADIRLTCPDTGFSSMVLNENQSLYLLYAHLNTAPPVTIDQPVDCGQEIGQVGTSGASVNPHLHLETRLGPSGARFSSLFHYDNRATPEQMDAYCTWRVRGIFQAFDPLILLRAGELHLP